MGEMLFEKTVGRTAAEGKQYEGYFIMQFQLEAEDGTHRIYHPPTCSFTLSTLPCFNRTRLVGELLITPDLYHNKNTIDGNAEDDSDT